MNKGLFPREGTRHHAPASPTAAVLYFTRPGLRSGRFVSAPPTHFHRLPGGSSAGTDGPGGASRRTRAPRRRAQPGDHRPRRPRQDDAGRRHALAERDLPRQRGGDGAGDGLQRPRAREGHHHPRQEHLHPLPRHPHQHRRHPRPRRLRRRGGAHAQDGRRRAAARRRQRGAAAADPLRAAQGARGAAHPDRGDQQDRPPRRAAGRGARRDLQPVHRPRRRRGAARLPGLVLQRQEGHLPPVARRRGDDAGAALRGDPAHGAGAVVLADDAAAAAGHQPRLRRLRRPPRHRPPLQRRRDARGRRRRSPTATATPSPSRSPASTATTVCAGWRSPRRRRATSSRWRASRR